MKLWKKETWNFHETGRDRNIKYSEGRLARLGNQRTEDTNVVARRLRIAKYKIRRYINFLLYIIVRWMNTKYFFFLSDNISCKNVFEKICNKHGDVINNIVFIVNRFIWFFWFMIYDRTLIEIFFYHFHVICWFSIVIKQYFYGSIEMNTLPWKHNFFLENERLMYYTLKIESWSNWLKI